MTLLDGVPQDKLNLALQLYSVMLVFKTTQLDAANYEITKEVKPRHISPWNRQ